MLHFQVLDSEFLDSIKDAVKFKNLFLKNKIKTELKSKKIPSQEQH